MNSTALPVAFFESSDTHSALTILSRIDSNLKFTNFSIHEMEYLSSVLDSKPFEHVLIHIDNTIQDFPSLFSRIKSIQQNTTVYICIDCSCGKADIDYLKLGVDGIISLNESDARIQDGLSYFAQRKKFISDCVLEHVFDFLKADNNVFHSQLLSARENEIINRIVAGSSYREVAEHLSISIETVRTHLRNAYRKLNVKNKVEARTAMGS